MDAALYLRISSDPTGKQLGVIRQREDCEKLCAERGWMPVEYVDNDVSASTGKVRPAYQRMLDDIREGRIGAVVCWHLDRLHRSPIELENFMSIADEYNVALATVTGDVDLSTDDGQFTARIMGAVARKETDRKRARQRRAAQQKAEQGRPHWPVLPFGYQRGDDGYVLDPVTAPLVKQIYADVLAGESISESARMLNAAEAYSAKGHPWSASTLSLYLRKPRNAGLREHRGEIVGPGNWPALVDEATWRAAQAVLNAPGRGPGTKTVRKHLLTGVLRCGKCGGYLSGNPQLQRTGGKPGPRKAGEALAPVKLAYQLAYACKACHGCSVRAEAVEPLVFDIIGARLAREDAVDLLRAEQHDTEQAEALRAEQAALLARLDELCDERADGMLDGPAYRRMTARIQEKLNILQRREQDAEKVRVFDGLPLGDNAVVEKVRELSPDRLRAVIAVLVEFTILPVGKGGKVFKPERLQVNWR